MQFFLPPFTIWCQTLCRKHNRLQVRNAAIAVDDNVFWMGRAEFYVYSGAVQRLPCMVRDFVFSDINEEQLEKK